MVGVEFQSCHTFSKSYDIWIELLREHRPDLKWYCQFKFGVRVLGCCAHVASVILALFGEKLKKKNVYFINLQSVMVEEVGLA